MKTSLSLKKVHGEKPALASHPPALRDLVRQVVSAVRPLKVILFGSRARGEAKPGSDYDLLVLMPDGTHRRHTSQKLHGKVLVMELDYDFLVATPGDLQKYGDHPSLVYKYALQDGVELYVA
ncbi:MAG TPA: nucleotidyltransferase domain-containing protein [bacterium]|nr:nucleotidyltransferase domain-containing protein [bacterium]